MQLYENHDNYMKMIDSLTFRHGYTNQGCLGITVFLAEEKKRYISAVLSQLSNF